MGRRGPAPAPTRVKLLNGETRPSRVNFTEPLPSNEALRMPGGMDGRAKTVWRRILRTTTWLKAPDADSLRCYCEAVSRYSQAARLYAATGPLTVGFGGAMVKNPLHQIVREHAEQVRTFARELGLTASARSGLHVEPERAADQVKADIGLPPRLRAVGDGD